jgi:hypothetical protein
MSQSPAFVRSIAVLVGVLALLTAGEASAAGLYKWTATDGSVTYSDRPQPATAEAAESTAPPAVEPPTPEPPAKPASPPTADEVLELAGVKPQLAATPARIGGEFRPRRGRLNTEDSAALEQILTRHFDAERLYAQVRSEFRKRAEARKLAEVAEWLRSPLGRKIAACETAAATEADARQRMLAFAPGGRGGPAPARVALVEKIDWAAGVTDGSLESMLAAARAMAMSMNRALPPDERQTSAQVERQIQQLRGQARAKLSQSTVTFLLYQYRTLADDELTQYADFLSSDAGRWYSATISKAMNRTVATAAQRAAAEVVRAIPPQRWSGGVAASPQH